MAARGVMTMLLVATSVAAQPAHSTMASNPVTLSPRAEPIAAAADAMLGRLPLMFVENRGQWPQGTRFMASRSGVKAYLTADSLTYQFLRLDAADAVAQAEVRRVQGLNLRFAFESAKPEVRLQGRDELPGRFHYFLGSDPDAWHTGVRCYTRVGYAGVYDGVDLEMRQHEGRLEYDVVLAPEADLEQVTIRVDGASGPLHLDADGALVIDTAFGAMRQPQPTTWQNGQSGERVPVTCGYRLLGNDRFGFAVPERDPTLAMVIDPGLVYSTYLGGSTTDNGSAVAISTDGSGSTTLTGATFSSNFPTTPGAFDTTWGGNFDVFVTRLSPAGNSLVYSTFIGGAFDDQPLGLALDASGAATVVGYCSVGFPATAGAFDTSHNGNVDGFVTKVAPAGNALVYSTFLGSGFVDVAGAVVLDGTGAAIVTGWASNSTPAFPTTPGAYRTTYPGGNTSAFVTRLSLSGDALVWSTYLGGSAEGRSMVLDASGALTIAGYTGDLNYPTTPGAFDTSYNGNQDAFVTRINAAGTTLLYSTFLGGSSPDQAHAVALDSTGAATVVGFTQSTNFVTTPGALSTTLSGFDGFVTKLSPTGAAVVYSTYLGGAGDDRALAVATDSAGAATVVGRSTSTNFPLTPDAFDATLTGVGTDGFITRLSASGALLYSTYLGGTHTDEARSVFIDSLGIATITGLTSSIDFPTTPGAYSTTNNLFNMQAFVTKMQIAVLDTVPPGVTISTPADGAVIGTTSVAVTASVVDTSTTTVVSTPAGITTTLPAGGGAVMGTLPLLSEGANVLSISATDAATNVGGTSVTVIRDTTLPVITIVSPFSNAVFGLSPATLTVDVVDATQTTVTFGANAFALGAGGGQVSGAVAIVTGLNDVVVTATDQAGNVATATVRVILDVDAPIVTIDSPASGFIFGPGQSSIAVNATIDDFTATTITSSPTGLSDGLPAGGGMVSGVIALSEGSNLITVLATDAAGSTGSAAISVVLDTTAPTILIPTPGDGTYVRGELEVEARADDPLPGSGVQSVDLLIDNVPYASLAVAPYEFDLDTTMLTDGPHTLTATARDGELNSSSASITVLVDNTAPVVSVISPFAQEWVSGTVPFEVQASDLGSGLEAIAMQAGGQPPTGDASVSYATPVNADSRLGSEDTTRHGDGPLAFSALAVDAVGNQGQTSIIANVDNTAPQKQIVTPLDGQIVSGTINIVAKSNDANLAAIELLVNGTSLGTSSTSPFATTYDTRLILDGALVVEARVTDLAGNLATCSVTAQVDNMKFNLKPTAIHLFGRSKVVRATIEGANLALLVPTDSHQLELRVPGGSPVPTLATYQGKDQIKDPHHHPKLLVEFDRRALVAAIQAGMAANLIEPNSTITVTLTADFGTRVIGTDRLKVRCGRRCEHDDED